jgi:benzodiazapine receptor
MQHRLALSHGRDIAGLAGFIVVCLAVGALGSIATSANVETWYPTLAKPSFNPPAWVFAPVWTTLYLMIAVSGWMVWRAYGFQRARAAFTVYGLQLVLNLAWSFLFFGAHAIGAALIEIIVLLAAIVLTIIRFRPLHSGAATLLMPYAAWVAFATLLNASIWALN